MQSLGASFQPYLRCSSSVSPNRQGGNGDSDGPWRSVGPTRNERNRWRGCGQFKETSRKCSTQSYTLKEVNQRPCAARNVVMVESNNVGHIP